MHENEIDKVNTLAIRLETLGRYHEESVSNTTWTGTMFRDAAKYLKKLSANMCGAGIVGCNGGPNCDWEHK